MKTIIKIITAIYASMVDQVRQVNRKYAKPELELTRFTKFCLLALRLYLLSMVLLMGWFLVQQVRSLHHG